MRTGIAFGLDEAVVAELETALTPYLIDAINNLDIPDVSSAGFTVSNMLLNLGPIGSEDIQIEMHESNNAIILTIHDFGGSIQGSMKYAFVEGNFKAVINPGGATIMISMPMAS